MRFFNKDSELAIRGLLNELDCGKILDEDDLELLGINKIGEEYGTLFFALHEGCVFFPDFFRKNDRPKGMHGYSDASDSPVLIMYPKPIVYKYLNLAEVDLVDIMPIILSILNVEVPNSCESKLIDKMENGSLSYV